MRAGSTQKDPHTAGPWGVALEHRFSMVFAALSLCCKESKFFHWGYGATAARLTPYQKVGSLNLYDLMFALLIFDCDQQAARLVSGLSGNTRFRT